MPVRVVVVVLTVLAFPWLMAPGDDALDDATPIRSSRKPTTTTAAPTTTTAPPTTTTTAPAPTTTTTAPPATTTTTAPPTTTTTAPPAPPGLTGPVRHLAPNGSDAADGLAPATAWRTFAFALPRLACGTTLVVGGDHSTPYVPAGTVPTLGYVATTAQLACGPSNGITITAAPGADPLVKGLVRLNRARYWTIDNIDVTWHSGPYTEHMVKLQGGVGWTWRNSELWGADSFAVLLVAPYPTTGEVPSGWTVSGNCVHHNVASHDPDPDNNRSHLIYVGAIDGGDGGRITRNVVFGAVAGHGIKLDSGSGVHAPSGVTVDHNTVADVAYHPVLIGNDAHDNALDGNLLVHGAVAGAVRLYSPDSAASSASNTISDTGYWRAGADTRLYVSDAFGLTDRGGHAAVDPMFDAVGSCAGYHPTNPAALAYGAYAP